MKKYIILFVFLFPGIYLLAQTGCCPYIDSIYTIPRNPILTDKIKIVTLTTTPNLGKKLYYSVSEKADTFIIKGCFWGGILTQLRHFRDTNSIGYLPTGTYTIQYRCRQSISNTSCMPDDSTYMSMSFRVKLSNNIGLDQLSQDGLNIYPNPTNGVFNCVLPNSWECATMELYNSFGGFVYKQEILNNQNVIDFSDIANGHYIVKIIPKTMTSTTHIITRRILKQ